MLFSRTISVLRKSVISSYYANIEHSVFAVNITPKKIVPQLIHTSARRCEEAKTEKSNKNSENVKFKSKALMSPFEYMKKKEKETFLECLRRYKQRPGPKSDIVPFIKLALKYMDEFGVNKDLEVYKKLLDVFPKGPFVPTNSFQVSMFHHIKEQNCAIEVLKKMEDNGVCPDVETEVILLNTFGKWGEPVLKCHRLAYWFPKFKNASPWKVPKPLPNDTLELAKEVIKRITSVDLQTVVNIYCTEDVEDAIEKTWIVSAISPTQEELMKKHDKTKPLFVEGPFRTWIGDKNLEYFILRAKPPVNGYTMPDNDLDDASNMKIPHIEPDLGYIIPYPSVHEQADGIIMSVCATGTSSKDSLLSWIRCLQKDNPVLTSIPVVFTLKKFIDDQEFISENREESPILIDNQR